MKEVDTYRIEFSGLRDIELEHIFECGQCFRWNAEKGGTYTGVVGEHFCKAAIGKGEGEGKTLILDVSGGDEGFWYDYFDLGTDYSEIKSALNRADKRLTAATESCHGIRILNQDFYEVLISFIISQNNNIPRIKKCVELMCIEYGSPLGTYGGRELYSFPEASTVASLGEEDFARLKFGYRSPYLPKASQRYLRVGKPGGTGEEMRRELIEYAGVGPKVANCVMLFGLRDFSAFPVDTWVRTFMSEVFGFDRDDIKGMQRYAEEHFGKYGGYAQQYLFYHYRG